MNILLVNKFYYLRGGAERSFFETESMLRAGGHRVIPFAMQDERNRPTPYARYFVDHVEFNQKHSLSGRVRIVPRVIYFRQARRKLERLLRTEPVDVAHLHNIAHQLSPSMLDSLRKFAVPVVQTLHDYKLICPTYTMLSRGQICQRCGRGSYYHAVSQRCNKGSLPASLLNVVEMYAHRALRIYQRGVDAYIVPSRFLRQKLRQGGVVGTPMYYLPNAIDLAHYRPHYDGMDYCVYFGRLSSEKGVSTLIRAMKGLPDFRLLIIGDGLQRGELEDLARDQRMTNVEFLGPLYGDDLVDLVSHSLFVVLPSQCFENCPFVVLEAFALGKPVVGSDLGGIPELISPGREGFLFRPGDVQDLMARMRYLFHHRQEAIKMGKNARQRVVQNHNRQAHYGRLIDIYESVLGRREGRRTGAKWEGT